MENIEEKNTENTENKKKIFIIGKSAKEYALAKKFSQLEEVEEIFVAPGNDAMKEFTTIVDIRETNIQELLEFVLENGIDLTVCTSENAIKANIAEFFVNNGQQIFAPTAEAAAISLYKSIGKKFMYKLRIPSAKFGVFEKQNLAQDYIKNVSIPVVLKTDEHQGSQGIMVCNSQTVARHFIEDAYARGEKKVLIEDFIYGHEFSYYVVTDGYHAIPIGSVANYKFSLDGEGGLLTSGMGSFTPDYKISQNVEDKIMRNIIFPTLNQLAENSTPYVGILGVDCVLTPNEDVVALEYNTFLQEHDCQSVLAVLSENILDLMTACAIGSFADDYETIDFEDKFAVSCVLDCGCKKGEVISGLDKLDEDTLVAHFNTKKNEYLEYVTEGGRTLLVTKCAKTLTHATEELYEEIGLIEFAGKKHRKDICAVRA